MAVSAVTNLFLTGWRMLRGESLNDNVITPLNAVITQSNAGETALATLTAGTFPTTVNAGVTAAAGGTQAKGTQLTGTAANITTCATDADSVLLPLGIAGITYNLVNSGAKSAQVFGAGTDTINGVATATGVAQAAAAKAHYFCTKSAPGGTWFRILSA